MPDVVLSIFSWFVGWLYRAGNSTDSSLGRTDDIPHMYVLIATTVGSVEVLGVLGVESTEGSESS